MNDFEQKRIESKERVQLEQEKKAFKELMNAIGNMGAIPNDTDRSFYKHYHSSWNLLMNRMIAYKRIAKLNEKYGLDEEV